MSLAATNRSLRLLRFESAAPVGAGGAVDQPKLKVGGDMRVRGIYRMDPGTAPAVGYPRVRQSEDGVNFDVVEVVAQDLSQLPRVVFPFDVQLRWPYVAVEFVNGAVPSVVRATATAEPR